MKKRFVSLLLCIVMLVTMLPVSMADETEEAVPVAAAAGNETVVPQTLEQQDDGNEVVVTEVKTQPADEPADVDQPAAAPDEENLPAEETAPDASGASQEPASDEANAETEEQTEAAPAEDGEEEEQPASEIQEAEETDESVQSAPVFAVQPLNQSARLGEAVRVTADAGDGVKYQWQYNASAVDDKDFEKNWENLTRYGYNTKTLEFTLTEELAQYRYRVMAENQYGRTASKMVKIDVISEQAPAADAETEPAQDDEALTQDADASEDTPEETAPAVEEGQAEETQAEEMQQEGQAPQFILQPADASGKMGDKVVFSADAGDDAQYQWQRSYDQGKTWKNLSGNSAVTKELRIKITEIQVDRIFRVVVSNAYGEAASNTVRVHVIADEAHEEEKDPDQDISASELDTETEEDKVTESVEELSEGEVLFTDAESIGDGFHNENDSFEEEDAVEPTDDAPVTEEEDTPAFEETPQEDQAPQFFLQPVDVSGKMGDKIAFYADAGDNVQYQWQRSLDQGKTWKNLSGNSAVTKELRIKITEIQVNRIFRVVASNAYGEAASNTVRINVITDEVSDEEDTDVGDTLLDGDFEYESISGRAVLIAYHGTESTITVPYSVGGSVVSAIGAGFLGENCIVNRVVIPGNVTSIDDHAFADATITIEGWNGTEALRFAKKKGYSVINRSNVTAEGFTDDTIDFSYLDAGRIVALNETEISMSVLELELLYVGASFYSPDDERVYLVESVDESKGIARVTLPQMIGGLTEGEWIYEIVDGYARILGYMDPSVTKLIVPDKLGGAYVNSIGEGAFVRNTALERITVHGNVVNIAEDAFASSSVCIQGYNGTTALKYAKRLEMPSKNITHLDNYVLKEDVVDFSYAYSERYDYQSEYVIKMRPAEAAQLGVGSLFYVPMYYGRLMKFYKVADIREEDYWTYISVEVAKQGEALISMSFDNMALYADWAHAEYADGVVASEEKGWLSDAFNWTKDQVKKLNTVSFSPSITYTPKHLALEIPLGKKLKLGANTEGSAKIFGELDITFTGSVNGEFTFVPLEMKKFGLTVGANATIKAGIKVSAEREVTDKKLKASAAGKVGYFCKDLLLAKVPLLSAAGMVSVTAGIYIKVAVSGEITVTVKAYGNFINYQWEKGKTPTNNTNFKFEGPTLNGGASLAVGPQFSLAVTIAALGDLVSIDAFLGLDCSAEIHIYTATAELDLSSYSGDVDFFGTCAEVSVSLVFEVGLNVMIPGLKDINWATKQKNDGVRAAKRTKRTVFELAGQDVKGLTSKGFGITILSLESELVKLHFEGDVPWSLKKVDHCTRGLKTVTFNMGNGKSIDRKTKTNAVIDEPDFTNGFTKFFANLVDFNTWYINKKDMLGDLKGWYVYEGCSGPGEFSKGKGTRRYWNFATDTVQENMTLYADWEGMAGKAYSVTFHWNYESSVNKNERNADWTEDFILEGAVLQEPSNIMRTNFKLKGWYKDEAGKQKWDFVTDTMPDSDLDLYASWEPQEGYDPWAVQHGTGNYGVEYNGHRYWHIAEYHSYSSALAYAQRYGGYLVTINDAGEQAFLQQYVDRDCAQPNLWLGITVEKQWKFWRTGEAVRYSNWSSGEPQSSSQSSTGHYYGAIIRNDGHWTTLDQNATAHFVIEFGDYDADPASQASSNYDVFNYEVNSSTGEAYVSGVDAQALTDLYAKGSNASIVSVYTDNLGGKHTVTRINDKAFAGTNLKSVTIPNTVKYIGLEAFKDCKELESVIIPSSVTSIGNSAFSGCTKLTSVDWSSSLTTIPQSAFNGCEKLQDIRNIGQVKLIESNAFYNCKALSGFTFPSGLTSIGGSAFYNCYALRNIKLPDSVTSVGSYAFQNCTTASAITVPAGLTYIDYNVFYGCSTVTDVFILSTSNFNCNGNPFSSCKNATFHVYMYKPNTTTKTNAWLWCESKLTGYTVISIGGDQRVSFSAGESSGSEVTSKAGEMIADAYVAVGGRITEPVVTREGMTLAGWYLDPEFTQKWNFATSKMPAYSITLYAKWIDSQDAFTFDVADGKAYITGYLGENNDVVVPDTLSGYPVTVIDEGAFEGSGITRITLPAGVKTIRGGAFNCANLSEIKLMSNKYFTVHDDGVLFNKSGTALIYALPGSALTTYQVPDTVTTIYTGAFANQPSLRKCFIPDTVTKINSGAFAVGGQLTLYGNVNTCAAKTYASNNLYRYNVYIVTFFDGSDVLTYMTAEAGQKLTDAPVPESPIARFVAWCRDPELQQEFNLAADVMPAQDLSLYIKYESLFTYRENNGLLTITGYKGAETDVVIPESIMDMPVVGIASNAFSAAKYTSVTVPDCVETIGASAFNSTMTVYGNSGSAARTYAADNGLTFKVLKYTVTFESWGGSLVDDMKVKPGTKITLPIPVRTGYYFYGWYTDTTFTDEVAWTEDSVMPKADITLYARWKVANPNVTGQFGIQVLEDGTAEIISYFGNKIVLSVPETVNGYTISRIGDGAFQDNETVVSITLPKTVTSIGVNAFANSAVKTVKGAAYVTRIEDSAFSGAESFESIDVSARLTTVGNSAFAYCNSLTDMPFKGGLESIGDYAFYACQFLDDVTLPRSLQHIGVGAFKACPRLMKLQVPIALVTSANLFADDTTEIISTSSSAIIIQNWARVTEKMIHLEWNPVRSAVTYEIYRKRDNSASFALVKTVADTSIDYSGTFVGHRMQLKVRALDENGEELCESVPIEVLLTPLDTPAVASVIQRNASSARMTLTDVEGAEGYEIWRARSEVGEYSLLKSVAVTSFTNTGLMGGVDYYYRVRAYVTDTENDGYIYSNWSDVYRFHMPRAYLGQVQSVYAWQYDATHGRVTWDPIADAEGYDVYRSVNNGEYKLLKQVKKTEYVFTIANNVHYSFKIAASMEDDGQIHAGPLSEATEISLNSIPTPVILSADELQTLTFTLKWTPVAGVTGYYIYRAESPDGEYTAVKSTTEDNAVIYGQTAGKDYFFKAQAYIKDENNQIIKGEMSRPFACQAHAVGKVTLKTVTQSGPSQMKLTWSKLNGVTGYEVLMSAGSANNFELQGTTDTTSMMIDSLQDGAVYTFKVRAFVGEGNEVVYGEDSEEESLVLIGVPTISLMEQYSETSILLMWDAVNGAEGYEVWRKDKDSGSDWTLLKRLINTKYTNTGLTVSNRYSYRLRAYNTVNDKRVYGPYGAVQSQRIYIPVSITSITRVTDTSATVAWTKVTGAQEYDVYRSFEKTGAYTLVAAGVTGLSYEDHGLKKNTLYYYKVVPASEVSGVRECGMASNIMGIRMLTAPKMAQPIQIAAQKITLSWSAVENATSYKVYEATSENGAYTLIKTLSGTSFSIGSLTQKKKYYYKVTACASDSAAASEGIASNSVLGYCTAMDKPVLKEIEQLSNTASKLTWGKVSSSASYEVSWATQIDGEYQVIKKLSDLTYNKGSLTVGQKYYFRVRPYLELSTGETVYGMYSKAWGVQMTNAPTISKAELKSATAVTLTWNSISGATGYRVFMSDGGEYKAVKNAVDTTATVSGLTTGKDYYFKVAPTFKTDDIYCIGLKSSATKVSVINLTAPKLSVAKQAGSGTVTLTWATVDDAAGYQVLCAKNSDELTVVKNTTSNTLQLTNLEDGAEYSFAVQAYLLVDGSKKYGPSSAVKTFKLLNAPVISALYQKSPTSVGLVWPVVNDAVGYEIQRKTGTGSYEMVKTTTETSFDDTELAVGTKYTYRIRAYLSATGGKSYSNYSEIAYLTMIDYTAEAYPESAHNYANSSNITWTYTIARAKALVLKFSSSTAFENNYDKLYITDANGDPVRTLNGKTINRDYFTGQELAGGYVIVPTDTVMLKLTTDGSVTNYGFSFDFIQPSAK